MNSLVSHAPSPLTVCSGVHVLLVYTCRKKRNMWTGMLTMSYHHNHTDHVLLMSPTQYLLLFYIMYMHACFYHFACAVGYVAGITIKVCALSLYILIV